MSCKLRKILHRQQLLPWQDHQVQMTSYMVLDIARDSIHLYLIKMKRNYRKTMSCAVSRAARKIIQQTSTSTTITMQWHAEKNKDQHCTRPTITCLLLRDTVVMMRIIDLENVVQTSQLYINLLDRSAKLPNTLCWPSKYTASKINNFSDFVRIFAEKRGSIRSTIIC